MPSVTHSLAGNKIMLSSSLREGNGGCSISRWVVAALLSPDSTLYYLYRQCLLARSLVCFGQKKWVSNGIPACTFLRCATRFPQDQSTTGEASTSAATTSLCSNQIGS